MAIGVRVSGSTGVTKGNTLTIDVTIPTGVVEGDLMLVQLGTNQGAKITEHSAPTGWTQIGTTVKTNVTGAGNQSTSSAWGKVAGAGEAGTIITFSVTTSDGTGLGLVLELMTLFGQGPSWLNVNSEAPNTVLENLIRYPALTPTVDNCMLLAFAHQAGDADVTNLVAPTGMSEEIEASIGTTNATQRRGHLTYQLLTGGANVAIAEKSSIPEVAAETVYDTGSSIGRMIAIAPPSIAEIRPASPIILNSGYNMTDAELLTAIQRDIP